MADGKRGPAAWVWALFVVVAIGAGSLLTPVLARGGDGEAVAPAVTEAATDGASAPELHTAGPKALDVLATLEVKGRAAKTGYDRDQFGQRWLDVDRNGCDTRNDILARDLAGATRDGPCKVLAGTLRDPYTDATIDFVRGQDSSADVQIDHVVALSDAWQKGAQQLTAQERARFANDPLNLLAVDGAANAQKGDGDAATWLPSNRSYRCAYVARQISVKAAYGLWVTQAEHDAIARVLASCPGEPALTSDDASGRTGAATRTPAAVHYANCDAARAAGAAPVREGEPGYAGHLDRDGDGVGCDS